MTSVTTKPELSQRGTESSSHLFDDWFDPIEAGIRERVRGLIEEMIRNELDAVLSRPRYGRRAQDAEGGDVTAVVAGHRHGSRVRTLMGTFGKTEIAVPRARLNRSDGKTTEWKSQALRAYQRRTPRPLWPGSMRVRPEPCNGLRQSATRQLLPSLAAATSSEPIGSGRRRSASDLVK